MEPIINPWTFYWIHVAGCIRFVVVVMTFFSLAATVICVTSIAIDIIEQKEPTTDDVKLTSQSFAVLLICSIILIVVPSPKTITKMVESGKLKQNTSITNTLNSDENGTDTQESN